MIMDVVQIIEDHEESLARVALPKAAKGFADIPDGLAARKQAAETVPVHVVETQELLGSPQSAIRRAHAPRVFLLRPGEAPNRF